MSLTVKEILKEIRKEYVSQSNWSGTWSNEIEDDEDRFQVVEQEDWAQNHKSQYRQSIYYDTKYKVYIAVNESRSGDYYQGWESHDAPDISVVTLEEKEVTKIVKIWNTVSLNKAPEQQPAP